MAKPIPAGDVFSKGFFIKRLQRNRDAARRYPPATKGDRRGAAVMGRARYTRPTVQCHAGCRCNKRRTLPVMGEEGVLSGMGASAQGAALISMQDGKKTGTGRIHRTRPAIVASAAARTRLEAVDHADGSPASGCRRRRRLFNA